MYTQQHLIDFTPSHDAFVGIDSDGCVFDTMEVKQRNCFHPVIIDFWNLQPIEKQLRETAEFVNLYSQNRGTNRFQALLRVFEMLSQRVDLKVPPVPLPPFESLRAFVDSGDPLSNEGLKARSAKTGDPELKKLLAWSVEINATIAGKVGRIVPFPGVLESLEKMKGSADLMVVSQTPEAALIKEWDENEIHPYVRVIAGQELGTKAEHLRMATAGRYKPNRVLMIGDAPGDRKAAQAVGALFYPIHPGKEETSWKRFHEDAFPQFLKGDYEGAYQDQRIREFDALLPATPPWDTL